MQRKKRQLIPHGVRLSSGFANNNEKIAEGADKRYIQRRMIMRLQTKPSICLTSDMKVQNHPMAPVTGTLGLIKVSKRKLDQILGLNRSARLNWDIGLWT